MTLPPGIRLRSEVEAEIAEENVRLGHLGPHGAKDGIGNSRHGTDSAYSRGCHCPACRHAHAEARILRKNLQRTRELIEREAEQ